MTETVDEKEDEREPERADATPSPEPAVAKAKTEAPEGGRRWISWLAAIVTLASLIGPISASGIWDPFELKVADLARRIALNLLGAQDLAIAGAVNSVPTLGELSRGQLPFTSVALGFKLFGLHEWSGRLPLAIWGMLGIVATYALVKRLSDRGAAAFSALALATMPIYFLHARTILGDIVTMASIALAVAGLGIAVFGYEVGETRRARVIRVLWCAVGAVGLAAGFGARGLLIGVAIPTLGVGLTWLVRTRSVRLSPSSHDRLGDRIAIVTLAVGVPALIVGVRVLMRAETNPKDFQILLGAALETQRQFPTFDAVIHTLGFGLFPWSAVVPFAVGRLLRPPYGVSGAQAERETALRVLVCLVAGIAFGVHALMAPAVGMLPFAATFALAVIAGVALRDFDRGAPGSRAMAMGVAAFAILIYYDFKNYPEKGLSAFVVNEPRFPDSFKDKAHTYLKLGTLGMIALFFGAFMEQTDRTVKRFDREEYFKWPKLVRTMWSGNLWFTFLVSEAALVGYAVLFWLSRKQFHWKQFEQLGPLARQVAMYGFVGLPILVFVLPPLAMIARDIAREAFVRLPISRGTAATLAAVLCGAVLSLGYYPALAAQISPKEVFEAYRRHAKAGEALAIVGVGSGTAKYYAGRDVPTYDNAQQAFEWMTGGGDRRWLVVRSADLPQLNSLYRSLQNPPKNVPVLDARSSEIMLLSNQLLPGEKNENPYKDWILDEAPNPTRRLDANLGGQLDVVGWDVTDMQGRPVDAVVPQQNYQFRIYYRVVAAISGSWETFIHIDGFQRRFNGDHPTLDNKYAFHLWRVGDNICDIYPFSLEPNFTPGDYDVLFGLFIGSRRLEVKRGRHNDNRVEAGHLRVK